MRRRREGEAAVTSANVGSAKLKVPMQLWQQRLDQIVPSTQLMDELVMNFLVHEGFKEGALTFAQESGVKASAIDSDTIDSRKAIRKLILEGNIESAIHNINELNPEVSRIFSFCSDIILGF